MENTRHSAKLLRWYDENARVLPWRAGPRCALADPYHVWLSEIMLQQTVVKAVIPYFETFLQNWPTVDELAACDLEEVLKRWAGLGYYARARNLHACARVVVVDHQGRFPSNEKSLLALPGIGPYTASAIRAIAFDQKATVVDGNVERVVARLYALKQPLRDIKPLLKKHAAKLTPAERPGDYAQAMMDLGATICTPKRPACSRCPVHGNCLALKQDCAASLPVPAPKKPKPVRTGTAFLALRADGCVLLRQRLGKGLLAKMLEVPATPWAEKQVQNDEQVSDEHSIPIDAKWQRVPGFITHTFTHFHLRLEVKRALVENKAQVLERADPDRCRWVHRENLTGEALPGVMHKVLAHGLDDQQL